MRAALLPSLLQEVAVMLRLRSRRLSVEFLVLTVPAIALAALVFFAALAAYKRDELSRAVFEEMRKDAWRDAAVLTTPLWNLDGPVIDSILTQLASRDRYDCVGVLESRDEFAPTQRGRCAQGAELALIEVPIRFIGEGVDTRLGTYRVHVDTSVPWSTVIEVLQPLLYLLAFLIAVLAVCVLLAFQRIILRPLQRVSDSIRAYRQDGKRRAVEWDAPNELGEFVREYNAGLLRQDEVETQLADQLNLQMTLRNILPTPFAHLDASTGVIDANPSFYRLFGLDPRNPPPPLAELVPSPAWAAASAMAPGEVQVADMTTAEPAAKTLSVLVSPAPGDKPGAPGYVVAMQDMTARIRNEQELRRAKNEAETALDRLRVTQQTLIRTEKLASLGRLVAGIAHEINTPLGNSITVASALTDRVTQFERAVNSGALKKSLLADFIDASKEACTILQRALGSAAEQVNRFKQVAVDQTSSQRRTFDLAVAVEEVLSTLRPRIKHTSHTLQVDVPPEIMMDSFPGPLGQVITNCFTNALVHGFDGIEAGTMVLSAEREGESTVHLSFSDDGRGIAPEHIDRVFDPFFTTKLGTGGSGLGLNLVYAIVTKRLGGQIELVSEPGRGTVIHLRLPLTAPADARPIEEESYVRA